MVNRLNDIGSTLLEMANERNVDALLQLIVQRLCEREHVALTRIWAYEPGDLCDSCSLANECVDRSNCLHLVASHGNPLDDSEDWNRIDGRFRRIPMGVRKVGHIGATKRAVEVRDVSKGSHWIADPDWAERENIRGFIGQPLLHQDQLIGVLGVFLRVPVVENALLSLRMVADHAASAMVNARAFAEIESLRSRLASENQYLRKELSEARPCDGIIGTSPSIRAALEKIELVAPTDTSVLILGETGTGKELIAKAIHDQSEYKHGPLIRVNCASVPRDLFESEFFGHIKGAFTGALQNRIGRFELAENGTLFLDEIGEVPLEMQSKLLRVLQEKTYERLGDTATKNAHCRIIAATNRNLKTEISKGRFREDLYYRLSVFPIEIPPLRERRSDIPLLAQYFLDLHCRRFNVKAPRLGKRDSAPLVNYPWPGNVRELQNIIEQAALRLRVGPLQFHLPPPDSGTGKNTDGESANLLSIHDATTPWTYEQLKEFERNNLTAALKQCNWKIYGRRGAAERLGIHPATLTSKMKAMGIQRPE